MDISFERTMDGKDEWLTPPELITALGVFDLDPCASMNRPWDTALNHFTIKDNGLITQWFGRVYCNPPYGNETGKWLQKMANHGNGIILIFARTETNNFFKYIWNTASSIYFLKGRLRFYHSNGIQANNSAGAPSCLVSYGVNDAIVLKNLSIKGKWLPI